ncbi:hypothetical protein SCHPADRAFT_908890, partial [Schizopora paradoxa]
MRMIKHRIFHGEPSRDEVEEYLSAFTAHAERTRCAADRILGKSSFFLYLYLCRISAEQARKDVSQVYFSCLNLANLTVETQYCYSGLRTILNDLEGAQPLLASCLESINKEIGALRHFASEIFMKTSFKRFPDEIFGIIFEFAGYQDLKSVLNISGVCRRFRNIALSIPRLWGFISLRDNRFEDAIALAERSKCPTPGLQVWFNIFMRSGKPWSLVDRQMEHAFNFIDTYSSRITSLAIDLDSLKPQYNQIQSPLYSSISLPFLESLKLSVEQTYSEYNRELGVYQYEHHWETYRTWHMPLLSSLHACNLFPELPTAVLSKVKNFTLDIDIESPFSSRLAWTLATLVQYISSMTSLEDLTIATISVSEGDFIDDAQDMLRLKLSSLRRLSVSIGDYNVPNFRRFFEVFDLRDLGSLSINITTNSNSVLDVDEWPNTDSLSNLTHFSLVIRPLFDDEPDLFGIINRFVNLSKLQNLYFEYIAPDNHPFNFSNSLCAIRINRSSWDEKRKGFPWNHWEDIEEKYRKCREGELDRCLVIQASDVPDYYSNRVDLDFESTEYSQKVLSYSVVILRF